MSKLRFKGVAKQKPAPPKPARTEQKEPQTPLTLWQKATTCTDLKGPIFLLFSHNESTFGLFFEGDQQIKAKEFPQTEPQQVEQILIASSFDARTFAFKSAALAKYLGVGKIGEVGFVREAVSIQEQWAVEAAENEGEFRIQNLCNFKYLHFDRQILRADCGSCELATAFQMFCQKKQQVEEHSLLQQQPEESHESQLLKRTKEKSDKFC